MYSTVHHSKRRGLAWALITPVIFLGKEKQWIEKKKISLGTQALWAESAARLRRVGWAEGGAKGGAWGIRSTVIAEGAGTCVARNGGVATTMLPFQHGRLEVGVTACMFHQVVTPHESLVAEGAAELLLACMGAIVPCQLIRASKLLTAVGPGARKGALSCDKHKKKAEHTAVRVITYIHDQSDICDTFKTEESVKIYKHLQIRSCSCASEIWLLRLRFESVFEKVKNKVLRRPHHKHHQASLTVINRANGANWCEPISFFFSPYVDNELFQ